MNVKCLNGFPRIDVYKIESEVIKSIKNQENQNIVYHNKNQRNKRKNTIQIQERKLNGKNECVLLNYLIAIFQSFGILNGLYFVLYRNILYPD